MPQKQLNLINEASEEASEKIEIVDSDLLEQLERVEDFAPTLKRMTIERLQRTQAERNDKSEKRAAMTPVQRRRDITRETLIETSLEQGDIHHIHSVLALCALPYRKPKNDMVSYKRKYGKMSLVVNAGSLADPDTEEMMPQGIPYGPKARLLMLHICTRALRQKSPVIELEDSLSAFIRSMGFGKSGGDRGTFPAFKEQIRRLAACTMQIGCFGDKKARTINTNPISSIDVWLPDNPDQKMLWNSTIVLSRDFYDSMTEHALPVDIRSLSAVSHSAKQIDILLWLSYRLKQLHKPYFLTWAMLKEQFSQSPGLRMDHFQKFIKQDFKDIEEIFEKSLPLKVSEKGVTLMPCDPSDYFVPPKKLIR